MTKPQGPTFFDWVIFLVSAHGAYKNAAEPFIALPVMVMLLAGATILVKIFLQERYQAWEAKQPKRQPDEEGDDGQE